MRRQRIDVRIGNAGKRPECTEHDGRDGEPAPQPQAREGKGGGGDDGEIDIERPIVRGLGRDEQRRNESAGNAEPGKGGSVQQRRRQCRQRHEAEQDESQRRRQKTVKREGGVDGGVGGNSAGGRKNARNVLGWNGSDAGSEFIASRPFAGGDQHGRKQSRRERYARRAREAPARSNNAPGRFRQRQSKTADPHHPLGAEAFFQRGRCCRGDGRGRTGASRGGSAPRRRDRLVDDGRRLSVRRSSGRCRRLARRVMRRWRSAGRLPAPRRSAAHAVGDRAR